MIFQNRKKPTPKLLPRNKYQYNNLDEYVSYRINSWKYLLMREEFLKKLVDQLIKVNNLDTVWMARCSGPDLAEGVSAIMIRWTEYYDDLENEFAGPEYNKLAKETADLHYAQIYVSAQGSEPGNFVGIIHYDGSKQTGFKCNQTMDAPEVRLTKGTLDLTAPAWFKPFLKELTDHNKPYYKK